jgi:hypothetical protein
MASAVHCDRDGCDTWQKTDSVLDGSSWVRVMQGERLWDFCSLWCAVSGLADVSEPPEIVDA